MARRYSRVTHRPAALVYRQDGLVSLLVVGPDLRVFAGLRLPRRVAGDLPTMAAETTTPALEQSNPRD